MLLFENEKEREATQEHDKNVGEQPQHSCHTEPIGLAW
jgi:hypothetical protein